MQFLQFKKQQSKSVVIPELDEAGVYYTNQIEERRSSSTLFLKPRWI
ncbi:hypothetical protein MKQ70_02240 [Chitinophaga sedimenti]|nr:hypothetical protein [Chitinophaga sedimenti]MCK7553888.1 hypothetical protein [Chitinophaga sedimenti]